MRCGPPGGMSNDTTVYPPGVKPTPISADATRRVERSQVTMIVPVIAGWSVHTKSYLPGAGAVASPVLPTGSPTAMSVPFTAKLWALPPRFATEMVDPEATVKQFGLHANSLTVRV